LDAAVVYQANVSEAIGELDVVPIRRPDATATQPIAIHKDAKYAYLTRRLIRMLNSKESQERFIKVGFDWRASMENQ
jgi:ABC-type molybdate transport system substrate-binding protein